MLPATVSEFLCARISEETGCSLTAEQLDSAFTQRLENYAQANCAPVGHTPEGELQYSHVDLLRCVHTVLRGPI